MFISDTTLLQSDAINIGWCAGNKDTPLAALLSRMVRAAGVAVDATETLLAGHSAGGFSAILVGSQVPNSHAVAMTPSPWSSDTNRGRCGTSTPPRSPSARRSRR